MAGKDDKYIVVFSRYGGKGVLMNAQAYSKATFPKPRDPRQIIESVRSVAQAEIAETRKRVEEERAREQAGREEAQRQRTEKHKKQTIKLFGYYGLGESEVMSIFLPLALENLSDIQVEKLLEFWTKPSRRIARLFSRQTKESSMTLGLDHTHYYPNRCASCCFGYALKKGMMQSAGIDDGRKATKDQWDAFVAGCIGNGNKPKPNDLFDHWKYGSIFDDFFVATSDFTLLPFERMRIIISKGVNVRGLENIGKHVTLYFMDGFRVVGERYVPIFKDTLASKEELKKIEEAEAKERRAYSG